MIPNKVEQVSARSPSLVHRYIDRLDTETLQDFRLLKGATIVGSTPSYLVRTSKGAHLPRTFSYLNFVEAAFSKQNGHQRITFHHRQ